MEVNNDAGANASTVTWEFSFNDNSLTANQPGITNDSFTIILTIDGENVDTQLPKLLEISSVSYSIKYNVTDAAGNSGFCSFEVEIKGKVNHHHHHHHHSSLKEVLHTGR